LIGVYEIQERREQDIQRKVELLHQIANLQEDAVMDVAAAFGTYCRALAVDPLSEMTVDQLIRLAEVTNRFEELATQFETLATEKEEEDHEVASQLYMASAAVVENNLANLERAVELYRKVISIDPVNLEAAESLQKLYQATSQYE